MHYRVLLPLLLCLSLPITLFAADWPQFRGPNANGIAPETGINKAWTSRTPKFLWNILLTDQGYSGPSVAGGKVFIIDHQGNQDIVRALDLRTGKDVWRFTYADASSSNYGFSRATPVVDGSKVYTLSRLGVVNCLDANSGKKLWARNIQTDFRGKKPQWDYSMSVLVDGNKLIVCPGGANAAVAALDKNSGKTLWAGGGSDMPGYATPVAATIGGTKQYVVFTAFNLIGVDAGSGRLLWNFPWKTGSDVNAATPIVVGNSIFITSDYGHGCAMVDISGGRASARWQNRDIQGHFNTPIYADGYLYGIGDPGNLVCLDARTGQVRWKQRGFGKGGLVGVDGTLIAVDGNGGDVVLVNMTASSYQELGRIHPLGGQSWTAPVVAHGKLLIRNTRALACIDLK